MKFNNQRMAKVVLAIAGSLSLWQSAQAGTPVFAYTSRDLILCFRKTGATGGTTGPNDFQVNVGQASLYYGAAQGSSFPVTNFTGAQMNNAFDSLNDLSWSVGATIPVAGDSGDASIPTRTLWVTAPRLDPNVPASPWVRNSASTQGGASSQIKTIMDNAVFYSGNVASNALNNTPKALLVPVGGGHEFGAFMGSLGNYANTFQGNVENTTPADFDTAGLPSRSDLYELRPGSGQPPGKYLGYFELAADGTLTFFAPSPSGPTLTLNRTNTTDTISFTTASSLLYTLHFTNIAGISTPTTNWPAVSTNITGNGSSQFFQVNSTDSNRVYRVRVH